jgi:hypothetical protein
LPRLGERSITFHEVKVIILGICVIAYNDCPCNPGLNTSWVATLIIPIVAARFADADSAVMTGSKVTIGNSKVKAFVGDAVHAEHSGDQELTYDDADPW